MEFTTKGKILLPYFLHHGKEAAIVEAKDLKGRLDLGIHVTLTLQEYIFLFLFLCFLCFYFVFVDKESLFVYFCGFSSFSLQYVFDTEQGRNDL